MRLERLPISPGPQWFGCARVRRGPTKLLRTLRFATAGMLLCLGAFAQIAVPSRNEPPDLALRLIAGELSRSPSLRTGIPVRSVLHVVTNPELQYPIQLSIDNVDPTRMEFLVPPATPPGHYVVQASLGYTDGSVDTRSFRIQVEALTFAAAVRTPVILLNGWQALCTSTASTIDASQGTFGGLAADLQTDGAPVMFFNNCAYGNIPIEDLAGQLGRYLAGLRYTDGTPVSQVDLVAHSMGGLIIRAYLAGLQTDGAVNPPINHRVRKVVQIATPNFGSFAASSVGVQTAEMVPGSTFLWNIARWNNGLDDMRGVEAVAVIGNAGSLGDLLNASDGVVSTSSASLGFTQDASRTRVVRYCHTDPGFASLVMTCSGTVSIAKSSEANRIVRSFLAGTADWQSIGTGAGTDQYLSQYGGLLFSTQESSATWIKDLTRVSFGTVPLSSGGATGMNFYADFVQGQGSFNFTSNALGGSFECGPYTVRAGLFNTYRCKFGPMIAAVAPLVSQTSLVVQSGGPITIGGARFGTQCATCRVTAYPGGQLSITAWSDRAITASLPAAPAGSSGFVTITVQTSAGQDSIGFMTAQRPALLAAPRDLQFTHVSGGTSPTAQVLTLSAVGGGTISWSAVSDASWLAISPSSGNTPAAPLVSLNVVGLAAGTYSGTITVSGSGVPTQTVPITLIVSTPQVRLSAPSIAFTAQTDGPRPLSQTVLVSSASPAVQVSVVATTTTGGNWISVSPISGTLPLTLIVSVNTQALKAATYSGTIDVRIANTTALAATLAVGLTVSPVASGPTVSSVVNSATFQPGVCSGGWASVMGSNLSTTTRSWASGDFTAGMLPTSLDGVSVKINGHPGYLSYISPTQLNILIPEDSDTGPVSVEVTASAGLRTTATALKGALCPAFFVVGTKHVAAVHLDGTLVARPTAVPGSRPARPGEMILLFGTGFGPTTPRMPLDRVVTQAAPVESSAEVRVAGVSATVAFAGIAATGLYQFNITVPDVPDGDSAITATVKGNNTQQGVVLAVQR